MTLIPQQRLPEGHALFARYALPPNELGYCGPSDPGLLLAGDPAEVAARAKEFDGAWPYLQAIVEAVGGTDALDVDVVRSYWIGGPVLGQVDPAALLDRLRTVFKGQLTGLLTELPGATGVLAHHSFHVLVVYPWVRFLDRDPATALRILQACRIRWGTVESIEGDHAVVRARVLTYRDGLLSLGEPRPERVRWRKDGASLTEVPSPGDTVSAHWDWVCDVLGQAETAALAGATQTTLDLVNHASGKGKTA
jgi:hypothetical protein